MLVELSERRDRYQTWLLDQGWACDLRLYLDAGKFITTQQRGTIMGFTVQRYENANSSNGGCWAVVLDHEHILFVGTYRECEDWLDLNEAIEITNQTRRQSRIESSSRDCRSRTKQWFQALLRFCNLRRAGQRAVLFLSGEAGHATVVEAIAIGVLGCMVYGGALMFLGTVTLDRAVFYRSVMKASIAGHAASFGRSSDGVSGASDDGLEITCDLAQSP